ncbi:hypothetical protein H4R35_007086, partial [Dimargaris xerosporica]
PTGDSHDQDSNQSTEPLSDVATLADPDASAAKKKKKPKKKLVFNQKFFADSSAKLIDRASRINPHTDTLLYQVFVNELANYYKKHEDTADDVYLDVLDKHRNSFKSLQSQLVYLRITTDKITAKLAEYGKEFAEYAERLKTYVKEHRNESQHHVALDINGKEKLTVTQLNNILTAFTADIAFNLLVEAVTILSVSITSLSHTISVTTTYIKEYLKSVPKKDQDTYKVVIKELQDSASEAKRVALDHFKGVELVHSVDYWDELLKGEGLDEKNLQ